MNHTYEKWKKTICRRTVMLPAIILLLAIFSFDAMACGSTDYNYMILYEGKRYKALDDFGPVSDAISKFCDRSAYSINSAIKAAGGTNEAVICFNGPIGINSANVKLEPEMTEIFNNSVETEIRHKYTDFKVRLASREETQKAFASETSLSTGESVILTPQFLKNINSKYGIYAVIEATLYDAEAFSHTSCDLMNAATDRRDLKIVKSSLVTMRFKVTKCSDGEILWIDEVTGTAEDIKFYAFFEKALPVILKQQCFIYSVLSNSSCIK